ncbi:Acyl-CoA thioesterase FadM [Micromonospora echinaurantiaca]|uniref:Acyl-CoA thioesterase FadM n=1 Tax=Micromonospora echinaurantiaca TaxID=47857 RepID=A0A1C5HLI1_9ACTN|nr:thioesterase family protein [Micromonospora echinaurantiaca]SCG46767.1 Acyl-CoA thioesterase FadM [Micromonospora echinaurantiaca]
MSSPEPERGTVRRLRPRYAGANIRTWIGFKTFMYLAEEATLAWFRERDLGPQTLYHRYGLGLEVVDSSVQLPAVLEVDDEVEARVEPRGPGRFGVRLHLRRDGQPVTVLRGTVTVALVTERGAPAGDPPPALAPLVVPGVAAVAPADPPPPAAEAYRFGWRARYFHCHYSDRVQHGSHVAALEEVVDRFLADRGLSVPRLLAERSWIPVVSRARVRLLADAHMDDEIETTFTVTEIVKDRAFDGRMDAFATGPGRDRPRHVATARILHGYAVSAGSAAGTLAELDAETVKALTGGAS